jgi:DNA-binding IclR family transcriptional regulator
MIAVSGAPGAREKALIHLTQQIREEFEQAPKLRMTIAEASRFWSLDENTCELVLARLLAAGFLTRDHDGRYWPR